MARYITLNLVNEQGTPHPWPGTPVSFEIGTEQAADAVWIGVSADGNTNQVYPLDTPVPTIMASWPRVYQGVKINLLSSTDESPAQVTAGEYVYSNSLTDFQRMVAACCIAQQVDGSPSPGACTITVNWEHITGNGTMTILVDGVPVVEALGADSGTFQVAEGSEIQAIVEGGNAINSLEVENDIDGQVYFSDNGSGEFGEDYTFTPLCGRVYQLTGVTTPGE